jgi:predicted transcriptional regulator
MDRLKADFIASLPMRPGRAAPCLLFERYETSCWSDVGRADRKMLPHPGKERSARSAALPGGRRLRRNFFKPGNWDNFGLVRTASQRPFNRASLSPKRALCYAHSMTANKLEEVLELAKAWPEAAQAELAELAREIDAGLGAGKYHATPEELAGIDRGLKAAREGRFATDERIEELFKKHRPA